MLRQLLALLVLLGTTACGTQLTLHQRADIYYRHEVLGAKRKQIQHEIASAGTRGALVYFCPAVDGASATENQLRIIPADSAAAAASQEQATTLPERCRSGNVGTFIYASSIPIAPEEYELSDLYDSAFRLEKIRRDVSALEKRSDEIQAAVLQAVQMALLHDTEIAGYEERIDLVTKGVTDLSALSKTVSETQADLKTQMDKAFRDLQAQLSSISEQLKRF